MTAPSGHRINAKLRRLPPCPECNAPYKIACRTPQGYVCAPHRSRERVLAGELIAVTATDARAAHQLRAIRELAGAINGKALRAAVKHPAVDDGPVAPPSALPVAVEGDG